MSNTLIADILQNEHDLRIRVTGRSMRPFINNGDIVTLRKTSAETLQCGDIVYFTTENNTPVLHRIISRSALPGNRFSLITKGDAQLQQDVPINAEQVLGKAIYVEKKLPLIGPFVLNLDSILCSALNRICTLLFSMKYTIRKSLQPVLCYLAKK